MSTRMRYGPRFSQHGASAHYTAEEGPSYASTMQHRDLAKVRAIIAHMPLHKRELLEHNRSIAVKKAGKRRAAKTKVEKDERLEAERRMLEAMRHVVSTLEFHLEELHRTRKIGCEKGLVNQYAIHNALVLLRTKCGVKFDANEYDHHVDLAQIHLHKPAPEDHAAMLRYEQQHAREQRNRRLAELFLARRKS